MRRFTQRKWRICGLALLAVFSLLLASQTIPVFAATEAEQISSSESSQTVYLDYEERNHPVAIWSVTFSPGQAAFKKEPKLSSGKIHRGVFHFGANDFNGIWDTTDGKLYLDANNNGDLTDDPVSTAPKPFSPLNTTFNIHLAFKSGDIVQEQTFDLSLYGYGNAPNVTAYSRSCWMGKVSLLGQEWQVAFAPTNSRFEETRNAAFLIRPWKDRDKFFGAHDDSATCVTFHTNLFLQNQAYSVCCTLEKGGSSRYKLEFKPQDTRLADVTLTGKYIRRIAATQANPNPFSVMIYDPQTRIKLPVGDYGDIRFVLEEKGTQASPLRYAPQKMAQIIAGKSNVLSFGGPLTNSVTVRSHGRILVFDYKLVGADGAQYQLANFDRTKPPQFAISRGGKQIATGKFEFG